MSRPRKPRASVNVIDWAYHRNGISGAPFHGVLFDDEDDENSRKVGILFDAPHSLRRRCWAALTWASSLTQNITPSRRAGFRSH